MDGRNPCLPCTAIQLSDDDWRECLARRKYIHFDEPPNFSLIRQSVASCESVAKWEFLPFLSTTITVRKGKRSGGVVTKAEPKVRPISYSGHRDSIVYAYYSRILSAFYEAKLSAWGLQENVTAFRKLGLSNIDLAADAFEWIKNKSRCVALAFDVKSFFDSLDHGILKACWSEVIDATTLPQNHFAVFRSITRYSSVDLQEALKLLGIGKNNVRGSLYRRRLCDSRDFRQKIRDGGHIRTNTQKFGIPQGSPISAILSNIYMSQADREIKAFADSVGGLYRRYCDDILLIVPPENLESAETTVETALQRLKLELQHKKTLKCFFENGETSNQVLQYLGLEFDGKRTLLRSTGIARYYAKMRSGVRYAEACARRAEKLQNKAQGSFPPRKRPLLEQYSHLGSRNYIRYALRAMRKFKSKEIRKQVSRHFKKLQAELL